MEVKKDEYMVAGFHLFVKGEWNFVKGERNFLKGEWFLVEVWGLEGKLVDNDFIFC